MRRIVTMAFALLASTALLAGVALAHSHYVSSTPAPGQTLQTSPAAVNITFDEDLGSGTTATVTDASGARVDTGATVNANDRTKLAVALRPSLPNGVYKVNYHSVDAEDGAIIDGSFFFGVGVAAPSTATDPAAGPASLFLGALGLLLLASSSWLFGRRPAVS